jgi:hypothetical protein
MLTEQEKLSGNEFKVQNLSGNFNLRHINPSAHLGEHKLELSENEPTVVKHFCELGVLAGLGVPRW